MHVAIWIQRCRLTRLNGIMQNLVDGLNVFIWRRMKDDDDGADKTDCAAQTTQNTKLFL